VVVAPFDRAGRRPLLAPVCPALLAGRRPPRPPPACRSVVSECVGDVVDAGDVDDVRDAGVRTRGPGHQASYASWLRAQCHLPPGLCLTTPISRAAVSRASRAMRSCATRPSTSVAAITVSSTKILLSSSIARNVPLPSLALTSSSSALRPQSSMSRICAILENSTPSIVTDVSPMRYDAHGVGDRWSCCPLGATHPANPTHRRSWCLTDVQS